MTVDAHRYSLRQPLRPHRRGGCCVLGGDGSGGSSCARMRAEAATGRTAPKAEVEPAAERLRSFTESSAHRQPPAARQMHPATGRRCESAAARMVGGGTHFDRGRDFQPPVQPSQSRRTSHDNRAAPCGSEMEPPTQPRPPASCLPLCPHCAPAPSFRPLSRGSTTQKPRFTDCSKTAA